VRRHNQNLQGRPLNRRFNCSSLRNWRAITRLVQETRRSVELDRLCMSGQVGWVNGFKRTRLASSKAVSEGYRSRPGLLAARGGSITKPQVCSIFPCLFWRDRRLYPRQLFVGLDRDSVGRGTNPQSAVYFMNPILSEDMSSSWPYRILIIFFL